MRLSLNLLLFAALSFTGCYVPGQTVWQGGNGAYNIPGAGVPMPGPLNTRSGTPEGMPSKPGSCYAKCLMPSPDPLENYVAILPIYNGEPDDYEVEVDTIEIVFEEGGTGWEKKKADRNCISVNPDDCMVWCLVETGRIAESYVVVKDTSATDLFEMTKIYPEDNPQTGGITEWREIVCDKDLTSSLIEDVQIFLIEAKFLTGVSTGKFDYDTRGALIEYQKINGLPVGQVDFETLDSMGVDY